MEINIKHMFDLCLIIALFLLFVKLVVKILNIYPAAPDTRAPTRKQKQSTMCFGYGAKRHRAWRAPQRQRGAPQIAA